MADGSSISSGTTIVGRVIAKGDLEIHGRIEGSVQSTGEVSISETALLKSDVKASRLHVAGAVAGNLHGEELLVLEETARVVGNIAAPSIGIRPGALIRGRVETSASPPKAEAPRARTAVATKAVSTKSAPAKQKAPVKRSPPAPVMPKASKTATKRKPTAKKTTARKTTAKKSAPKRRAPAPVVPALKSRTKKASKRRSR